MTVRIGINGFGRIGRLTMRALQHRLGIEVVHVNEIKGGVEAAAHLLEFDTVHGRYKGSVAVNGGALLVDGREVGFSAHQTQGLVGVEFLARMRDGALLVNLSRGPVVDTDALVDAVASGRIRAALDVTDPEPLPSGHPLWTAPGVLISPHVGGNTTAFLPRARRLVADQLGRFAAGQPLASVVVG